MEYLFSAVPGRADVRRVEMSPDETRSVGLRQGLSEASTGAKDVGMSIRSLLEGKDFVLDAVERRY